MDKRKFLPVLALIFAAIFGGLNGVFAKLVLHSFTPFGFSTVRYVIVFFVLVPVLIIQKKYKIEKKDIPQFLIVSLFWAGNQFFFLFAIVYTTVIMSQVMYFFSPLIVLVLSKLFLKKKFFLIQIIGIILGMIGASIIVTQSYFDQSRVIVQSIGTFKGNILLLIAVVCWSLYLIFSKKITKKYTPLTITAYSGIAPFLISFMFLIPEIQTGGFPPPTIGIDVIVGLLGLILGGSILMVFLYQWGIKYSSSFAASSVIYLSPISAALVSIPLFKEQISWQLFISILIVMISVYLTTIYPLINNKIVKIGELKR